MRRKRVGEKRKAQEAEMKQKAQEAKEAEEMARLEQQSSGDTKQIQYIELNLMDDDSQSELTSPTAGPAPSRE